MLFLYPYFFSSSMTRPQIPSPSEVHPFTRIFSGEYAARMGDDFFVADLRPDMAPRMTGVSFRSGGYLVFFCTGAEMDLEVNQRTFHADSNSLIFCLPDYQIRMVRFAAEGGVTCAHCVIVGISPELISRAPMNFNHRLLQSIGGMKPASVVMEGDLLAVWKKYLTLATEVAALPAVHRRTAIGSLVSSCFSLLDAVVSRKFVDTVAETDGCSPRTKQIFERFLRLVDEFHTSERNVGFYAERLRLTPKYLSKLVRLASGRSAPDWIDSFVIFAAKNQLRHTDLPIKEVVFNLHFPNQSVFNKYFKMHTGMTPSEYRNA